MAQYIRLIAVPLALGSALLLGACQSDSAPRADSGLAADSALNRDLALAGQDTAVQPQLQDVAPATPAGAPAATPAAPARPRSTAARRSSGSSTTRSGNTASSGGSGGGRVGTIAAGSELRLSAGEQLCTSEQGRVGSTITATVAEAVRGSNGAVIPAGAVVTLEVTQLKRSENVRDEAVILLRPVSVRFDNTTYDLSGEVVSAQTREVSEQPKGKTAQKVAIGAAAGALAGQMMGKNTKSTVVGAAVGAAAGAGVAAATANKGACIDAGATMTVKLNDGVQVRV